MKYEIFLAPRARKQFEKFDRHIRKKINDQLWVLSVEPDEKGFALKGYDGELRYLRMAHGGVQYRAVYDTDKIKKEVLVVFLGSRENFYRELHRFIH